MIVTLHSHRFLKIGSSSESLNTSISAVVLNRNNMLDFRFYYPTLCCNTIMMYFKKAKVNKIFDSNQG